MASLRAPSTVAAVTTENARQRVEVSFVGPPPVGPIRRASGVTEIAVDGATVRCVVAGSFQPFLEALRGHEVTTLWSTCDKEGLR